MMLNSHINTTTRQKIFRELAINLQKALYNALTPRFALSVCPCCKLVLTFYRNSVSDLPALAAEEGITNLLSAFDLPTTQEDSTSEASVVSIVPVLLIGIVVSFIFASEMSDGTIP